MDERMRAEDMAAMRAAKSAKFSDVGRFIAYNDGVQLILDSHN